jgi:hypothetical protein
MIGLIDIEHDRICLGGYALAKTFRAAPTGYDIHDYRGDAVGWAETEFLAMVATAQDFYWHWPDWEECQDGEQLILLAIQAVVRQSSGAWIGDLSNIKGEVLLSTKHASAFRCKRNLEAR